MALNAQFDVIIIGGGHAGTEAALASARIGARTLLLTHSIETLGQMSCNPAIGGIGKGHLVKEIDALGGIMAKAADHAGIHFRILNASKGPAVRATRAQADRSLYRQFVRRTLENQENLYIFQQAVDDLIIENHQIKGVITQSGLQFYAKSVVLTAGTFLGGQIHIGLSQYQGGRAGDPPANALAKTLRALPFNVKRLKTGTPPRIDRRSIDYSDLAVQPGDYPTPFFSFTEEVKVHPEQVVCYITHTNEHTHDIIRSALDRSPMYTGVIEGIGPRYCPSIEDKVVRFSEKKSHQIFIEPEGLDVNEVYPNGISTSLPFEAQVQFVHSMKGFEKAHITRPGYAIEYDFFDPRDLKTSLETKCIQGLFFAGQINGTTGYEEAAAQGLIAGLNAARFAHGLAAWSPARDLAYIGVLIDDLTTLGTLEPYRMFTSRAEYRLSLREDNADLRLSLIGRELGLVSDKLWDIFCKKRDAIESEKARLRAICIHPNTPVARSLELLLESPISREQNAIELLKRPALHYQNLMTVDALGPFPTSLAVCEQVEIQVKYDGYIQKQQQEIEKQRKFEKMALPVDFDYTAVKGLSNEVLEKLQRARPLSIGQVSRIPGITPAAISLLIVHLKKYGYARETV